MNRNSLSRLAGLLALLTLIVLAGCNTMEGAGEDIESAGEAIEEEAE